MTDSTRPPDAEFALWRNLEDGPQCCAASSPPASRRSESSRRRRSQPKPRSGPERAKDHATGLSTTERALVLNPSCATAMYLGALTNAFAGRPAVAITLAERALRLSPFDVLAYQAHFARGAAAMQQGRYPDAGSHIREALQVNANLSSLYFAGAAALALAGEADAAGSLAQRGLELEPGFRLRLFSELMAPAVALRFAEGCRLLGLPE